MVQKSVLLFCIREFYILCLEELKSAQRIVKKGIVVDWYHGRMIGMSVKRLLLVCMMILCLVLAAPCVSGLASDSPQGDKALPLRDFVEQVLAPMAKANDYEWRIMQEFSNEELGALIEACEANGIVLPEDGYLTRQYRDGESYGECSAISEVCETVYGRTGSGCRAS